MSCWSCADMSVMLGLMRWEWLAGEWEKYWGQDGNRENGTVIFTNSTPLMTSQRRWVIWKGIKFRCKGFIIRETEEFRPRQRTTQIRNCEEELMLVFEHSIFWLTSFNSLLFYSFHWVAMAEYKVEVTTGNLMSSITKDSIFVTLIGSNGESEQTLLAHSGLITGAVSCNIWTTYSLDVIKLPIFCAYLRIFILADLEKSVAALFCLYLSPFLDKKLHH